MKRLFCAALLAAAAAVPASAIVIRHDVDGETYLAKEADFPFLFGIYRTKAGFRDCVATLIAPQWAVTASHCTLDKGLIEGVAKGKYPVEIAGREMRLDRIERFSEAPKGGADDIALLHISEPVAGVTPARIYRSGDELGRIVLFPGWGDFGTGAEGIGKAPDGKFRIAENRVDRAADGVLTFLFDSPASGRALPLEGISGPGDSGGPALIMTPKGWATAGVSSVQRTHGGAEGLYGVEEVYARVRDHAEWIDGIIAEH